MVITHYGKDFKISWRISGKIKVRSDHPQPSSSLKWKSRLTFQGAAIQTRCSAFTNRNMSTCAHTSCPKRSFRLHTEVKLLSRVQLFVIPQTVAYQAPSSADPSRPEYWECGLPFPSPGDLLNPGIEPRSPALQADTLRPGSPGKPIQSHTINVSLPDIVPCWYM